MSHNVEVLVAVSIGNTTIHCGVWDRPAATGSHGALEVVEWPRWRDLVRIDTADFDPAKLRLNVPETAAWRVASVHRPSERRLADWVGRTHGRANYRNLNVTDLPLQVHVEHPERVGMDRLVAAVAVNRRRQATSPAIIVDAGTAVTVDLVNADGQFLGGSILPGRRLIARALAADTDQLPEVGPTSLDTVPAAVGRSTVGAIQSGLFWGSVGAIRELVHRLGDTAAGTPQLFMTGGDAEQLAPHVSPDAQFVPNLIFEGILASSTADARTP